MNDRSDFRIKIDGVDETIAALRALEPDVLKRMQKEIRAVAKRVASEASSRGPSGHQLKYSIRQRTGGRRGPGMTITAKDRDSAIFEFAGSKMSNKSKFGPPTPQGAAMIKWLDGFGKPGRFLWASWNEQKDAFEAEIRRAVGEAEKELQRHLDSIGETF